MPWKEAWLKLVFFGAESGRAARQRKLSASRQMGMFMDCRGNVRFVGAYGKLACPIFSVSVKFEMFFSRSVKMGRNFRENSSGNPQNSVTEILIFCENRHFLQ